MKFIDFEFKLIQIQLERNKIHDGARGIQVFFMNKMLNFLKKEKNIDLKFFFSIPLYLGIG
jgi:hypothetical protein